MSLSNTALVTLVQAKNYIRVNAASNLRIEAEYVGVGDGADKTFDLDNTPVEGSLRLYVNGVLQVEPTDFSISGVTITFVDAPTDTHPITASYDMAAGANTFEAYDDDLLEILIEAATKMVEDYTGRAFIQRDIIETRIGDGSQILELYKRPITDVATITIGGEDLTSWSERFSIGRLYNVNIWTLDYEIVITYTAGYGADRAATQVLVPDAVAAVLGAIATWYENRMGIKSQNISGIGSIDYGDLEGLPESSKRKLSSLRVNTLL